MTELTQEEALFKIAAFCSTAEHCAYEVEQKLIRWNVPEKDRSVLIARLYEEKYLDDTRYCRAFANDKLRYNKWGRRKIREALWQKRMPDNDVNQALQQLDENEYIHILHDIIRGKERSLKSCNTYERNGKLIRFALSRGFEMELILRFLPDGDITDGYAEDDE